MKKLLLLGAIVALFTVTASAQQISGRTKQRQESFHRGQLTRGEKFKMHKNHDYDHKRAQRHSRHGGKFTKAERKRFHKMRKHNRHGAFRHKRH